MTRSGTNQFDSSVYHYCRAPELQLELLLQRGQRASPKNEVIVHQYGGRVGRSDRHPRAVRRPRQGVLLLQLRAALPADRGDAHPDDPAADSAQNGIFTYNVDGGGHARRSTCWRWRRPTARSSTLDPTIGALLTQIRAATATTGTVNDDDERATR